MDEELIYSQPPLDVVWPSEPEHKDRREKIQAQCCWHKEHNTPTPMSALFLDVAAVSNDDSSIDFPPQNEMSKS